MTDDKKPTRGEALAAGARALPENFRLMVLEVRVGVLWESLHSIPEGYYIHDVHAIDGSSVYLVLVRLEGEG